MKKLGKGLPYSHIEFKKLISLYENTHFGNNSAFNSSHNTDLQPFEEQIGERGIVVNHDAISDIFRQIDPENDGKQIELAKLKERMKDLGLKFTMDD